MPTPSQTNQLIEETLQEAAAPVVAESEVPRFIPPEIGELIVSTDTGNTYRIGSQIGEGNFGVVHQCTDTWKNELAVKILKPSGTYEQVRDSAVAEFQKLRLLRHPNITYVFDAFEYRHTFYIVFEKCWQSINEFIQRDKFEGKYWVTAIARQLLQAVHFIHCNNFAHQDIHGGNVFVATMRDDMSPDNMIFTYMLGDLGIAKLATEMDPENTILADWMRAPESLDQNEFGLMDTRMDIYHCGLLFLQIILGKPLSFTREEVLQGKPRELALQLGSPFSFALEKALRRHVDHRTATAMEFWRDLNSTAQSA
jgi:eukaryotic-like serine/threonine-protein kinase